MKTNQIKVLAFTSKKRGDSLHYVPFLDIKKLAINCKRLVAFFCLYGVPKGLTYSSSCNRSETNVLDDANSLAII